MNINYLFTNFLNYGNRLTGNIEYIVSSDYDKYYLIYDLNYGDIEITRIEEGYLPKEQLDKPHYAYTNVLTHLLEVVSSCKHYNNELWC